MQAVAGPRLPAATGGAVDQEMDPPPISGVISFLFKLLGDGLALVFVLSNLF